MKKILILLLGLLALALLAYFCANKNHGPAIQDDIQTRSTTVLTTEGFDWANVSVDGRDITLTGVAPSEPHKTKAGELAKVYGYRLVDNQIKIKQAAVTVLPPPVIQANPPVVATGPYNMTAELDSNRRLLLTGNVPDAETHAQIVKFAQEKFGKGKVVDKLEELAGAPAGWPQSVIAGLTNLHLIDVGQAEWSDNSLNISGDVASESVKTKVTDELKVALPEGYETVLILSAPAPVSTKTMSVEDQAAAISCQDQFVGLLSNSIITFQTAKAEIATDSYVLLDKLAGIAGECPAANVTIEGYTDSKGAESYNQRLSQDRAQSVVDYLVREGVNANRLTAVGFGEDSPIADNTTSEGRALNRRIEFTVKGIQK